MGFGKRSGAGERVLEGRHVIGLFFLMLLFSGVFFTLGYVMGRNQLEGQVRAASSRTADPVLTPKQDSAKQSKGPAAASDAAPADSGATPPSSDWEFYRAGEKKSPNDHLKPVPAAASSARTVPASARTAPPASARTLPAAGIPRGAYLLQVAAVRTEADALSLASDLKKQRFPAFVQSPQGDKYYRVQVGPYSDQKAMQVAKKGLETAGFKAIIKH